MSEETIQIIASNLTVAYFAGHERHKAPDQDSRLGSASVRAAESAPFETVINAFERFQDYVKRSQTEGSKGT
jgi:hypothetical protein